MGKQVAIVVLNYRNFADTIACLRSLAGLTYPQVEIIVVDNNSQNDSLEHVHRDLAGRNVSHVQIAQEEIDSARQIPAATILVQSAANRGYAAGNNLGIRLALARGADYVLLLNNDTVVEPGFLEPLVAHAEANPQVGATGPKILDADGRIQPGCARRRPTLGYYFFGNGIGLRLWPNNPWRRRHLYQGEYAYDRPMEVDILSGSCMLIKRQVFEQIGELDENTFLYLEEFILHEKMQAAGWAQAIVPESVIVHKGGQSASRAMPEPCRVALRQSRRYYLKHYRHYGWWTVRTIELVQSRPPAWLRQWWRHRKDAGRRFPE